MPLGLLLALILAVPCLAASPQTEADRARELEEAVRRFAAAYSIIEQNHADAVVPEQQFYQGAIPGMLRTLDPYSMFFDAEQFRVLQQHQQSRSEGFGTIVTVTPGRVIVLEVFVGSPAARAGIQPGDELLEVNGFPIDRLGVEEIVQVLTAARARQSRLLVLRPNSSKVESIVASPVEMSSETVDRAFFLRPGIGYLHVTSFEAKTAEEVRRAIENFGGPLKGLVLDLRDNTGGVLNTAIDTAATFLPAGTALLTARGRYPEATKTFTVETAHPAGQSVPLVVLVGPKTASAAEIVAAAFQDHGRARLVGLRTFGKGTVQSVYPLSSGTGLALATGRYVTPSGRFIERTRTARGGIDPDVEVAPHGYNDLQAYLEAYSLFLEFARQYIGNGRVIPADFEVSASLLDQFRGFLSDRDIPIRQKLWSDNQSYFRVRLKTEIYNLAFGVAKGDQVAAAADPQVRRALEVLSTGSPVPERARVSPAPR